MPGAGTTPRFAWPNTIDSTNKVVRYTDSVGVQTDATLAEGDHFWRIDGTANDLAKVVEDALDAAAVVTGDNTTHTVTLTAGGVMTITGTKDFTLRNGHLNTTWDYDAFGMNIGGNYGSVSLVLTVDHQVEHVWLPEQFTIDDTEEMPRYALVQAQLMSGRTRTQRWGAWTERTVAFDILPPEKVFSAEETVRHEAFERFYAWVSQGRRFEYTRDWENTKAPDDTYVVNDPDWMRMFPVTNSRGTIRRFDLSVPMLKYVS